MNRIKDLRKSLGLSQKELADKLFVNQTAVSQWERGVTSPNQQTLITLAKLFNVSTDYLLGQTKKTPDLSEVSNVISFENFKQIPIIGTIACGEPILAEENYEGYTNVELNVNADFALRCKGDSMSPKFLDGDVVLIRQQPIVENGQIAAVLIDTEATLKHVYLSQNEIVLVADNLNYHPLIFTGEDMNRIRILGLAIGYTRIF